MATSVNDAVARFAAVGSYDENPVTATSGSFTPADNSLIVVAIHASEASTNAAAISSVSGGGLTWTHRITRGVTNNGGGTNSPGFVSIYTAPVTTGASMTVSTAITWADNFVAYRVSGKVYVFTGEAASPIGTTGSGGPTQTPAAGAEYTPTLFTATGAGRAIYAMTEQDGSSGSAGISTSTDTEDAAYYATELVGVLSAYKASDHSSGSISGSIDPTAQTYVNWVALEVLAAASGSYSLTCAQGSYALTGQAVGLSATRILPLAQGSYALSGQDIGLTYGNAARSLIVETGFYTLVGSNALVDLSMNLETGFYTLNGQAVGLTYTPLGNFSLTCDSGNYALNGQAVNLLATRSIILEQGSYAYTGFGITTTWSGAPASGESAHLLLMGVG